MKAKELKTKISHSLIPSLMTWIVVLSSRVLYRPLSVQFECGFGDGLTRSFFGNVINASELHHHCLMVGVLTGGKGAYIQETK